MKTTNKHKIQPAARAPKWVAVRRGDGTLTGYVEMFWAGAKIGFVTIPGASRWKDAR